MPVWFNIDHRYFVFGTFGVTAGIAIYSTYKLRSERRRRKEDNVYESEKLLNEYLVFHYGSPSEILKVLPRSLPKFQDGGKYLKLIGAFGAQKDALDFPKRGFLKTVPKKFFKDSDSTPLRAFDIGCAVGRSSFELTQKFTEVIGLDYSQAFVDACNSLKQDREMPYFIQDEGDLVTHLKAVVPHSLSTWLGGYIGDNGRPVYGFDTLKKTLGPDFDLIEDVNMPFFIRETAHKNQWSVAHATVWRRKS
ncbi:uncharacterized protein LOC123544134 [Mercenaria mercenaria]|uniref:uncharacterized protein LOC123544134 n=1 Tax=Mercenaria mercenaria TaxID=6596 RepID=UPI00234F2E26|nr:uncharacterized protein LOC123544134 [Mercenaria mercenaria]